MKNPCIFKRTVLLFCVLLFIISGSSSLAVSSPTDISKHWAKKEITSANNEGWAYLEKGKFSPDKSATREEAVWMLIGACKLVAVRDFDINKKADLKAYKDKPSAWAQSRMAIAIANNLIKGYSDKTIKPKAPITRAEFAVLLSRKVFQDPPSNYSLGFYDIIPMWAFDGIKRVSSQKIIRGYPNNTFMPNNKVTKAEALVMINRWKEQQPPPPIAVSAEFKKALSLIKGTQLSLDNKVLSYYGTEGKKFTYDTGKISVENNDTTYVVTVYSQDGETLTTLASLLKNFISSDIDKVIAQMKQAKEQTPKIVDGIGVPVEYPQLTVDGKIIKFTASGQNKIIIIPKK